MFLYILRNFCIIISLIFTFSCRENTISLGKLSTYSSLNYKSFSFEISDKFIENDKSKIDPKHPIINKRELHLLKSLLKKNNYCINNKGKLLFEITSKQPEIYDITLADVYKKQYNAKSLTPVTYFGKCL